MISGWSVHDDIPRDLRFGDYEDAKRILERVCQRHGIGTESVGYFGKVGHPGISDIDAVIVGDGVRLTRVIEDFERQREDSAWLRSMFWHQPLYVLEDALTSVPHLHTLVGLSEPLREEILGPATSSWNFTPDSRDVLHGIWMTFLTQVVAGLRRQKEVSARTLLLVHKNLEYSEHYFSGHDSNHECRRPTRHRDSGTVRRLALEEHNVDALALDFTAQHEAAQHAFSAFCRQAPHSLPTWANPPVLVYRRFVCIRGSRTAVRRVKGGSVGVSLPWPFDVTRRFARGLQSDDAVGQYIRASMLARELYRSEGLRYPFIGPFGLRPPRGT